VEPVLLLVLLMLLVAGTVVTGTVVGTRRAVRALRSSSTVRRAGELGGYATLAVGVARHPARVDRTAGVLAARVTAASVTLQREVAVARRAGAHLGEVPTVLPRLADEGFALSRALRLVTTTASDHSTELHEAARAHLAVVADVTAAVRASTALPAAHGIGDEAARVAADLKAYAGAYRELVRPTEAWKPGAAGS
jgi:hypothetical protein